MDTQSGEWSGALLPLLLPLANLVVGSLDSCKENQRRLQMISSSCSD